MHPWLLGTRRSFPEIVVLNIPKDKDQFISYQAIEAIKDGCIVNTKYESGGLIFNSPHLIIFANAEPNYTKLSEDRWLVTKIE